MVISDEARAERNAYLRAWRAKNRDKVRAANSAYWERKAANKGTAAALRKDGKSMSKRKTIKCLKSKLCRSQKKIRELQNLNLRLLQDAADFRGISTALEAIIVQTALKYGDDVSGTSTKPRAGKRLTLSEFNVQQTFRKHKVYACRDEKTGGCIIEVELQGSEEDDAPNKPNAESRGLNDE